eukprot:TRINITY_DN956_c0_g1_i1.p2 TRINITY_DN956_c0_g1~~TRINITY_DN956_c0_g1_i1.p2  ORF type:complete len:408 (-),score=101.97 TRINITY_DN956_c0_g1_i1:54-1277(-)
MKFQKPPKLVKKLAVQAEKRPPVTYQKQQSSVSKKKQTKDDKSAKVNEKVESPFEIQGSGIEKAEKKIEKEEDPNEFFENRVLKGLPPELADIPDLKPLAQFLQRDICISNPGVMFNDIVGLNDAKRLLKEAVLIPLKYPQFFTGILEPWKGVLLFGPPGTGKTMLAKAVATECKTTFFNISASSIVSKWRGDSEKLIRVLFELARYYQPSTIFLDELDSIMTQRNSFGSEHEGGRRMKTELLIQLDGLVKNKERVFLLAASNLPWDLDVAMLRRLEKRILVPLPEQEARIEMVKKFFGGLAEDNLNYQKLGQSLTNYSGSDIKLVCKEAAMKPLRRLLDEIEFCPTVNDENQKKKMYLKKKALDYGDLMPEKVKEDDVFSALEKTKPSPSNYIEKYIKWYEEFGSC